MVINLNLYALYGAGTAFYTVYILGLFLVFFDVPALKESFSAVFLIVAGGSSFYVGEWLEFYMEPLVPYFVQFFLLVIRLLGVPAAVHNPNSNVIWLNTSKGTVPVLFAAGCIGIFSFLAFSVIIVVTMIEEPANVRTKLLWALGGAAGTFFINIIRVSLIAWVIYHFGYKGWGVIHSWIGYSLFLLWLVFFFVIFSKREVVQNKIRALWQKS